MRTWLTAALLMTTLAAQATDMHKVVLHLDENDPQRMNLVLNNASNVNNFYQDKGEEVQIEIVAYGPGLHMLRADTSPVKDRITSFSQNYDNISFKACGNTHAMMSKQAGKTVELVPQAELVPSGVIQLIARQEEGWSYIRP